MPDRQTALQPYWPMGATTRKGESPTWLAPAEIDHQGGNACSGIALACLITLPFWLVVALLAALLV
jgi:hypothetical protein